MWSLRKSGSFQSSSDFDSSQGSNAISSGTSTGPSRYDSFSASLSRLDSLNSSGAGQVQTTDFTTQTNLDEIDKLAPPVVPSPLPSAPATSLGIPQLAEGATSATNSTTDHSSTEPDDADSGRTAERAVSPMLQKWVEESCLETERQKSTRTYDSRSLKTEVEDIKEEDANPESELALQRAFEYSLRSASPMRAGSLDCSFGGLSDFQSQLSPTENMLLGLGFAGPDLGIPVRFLKSWRERLIKQRISQLQGMLGQYRKSPSPTGSARQYQIIPPKELSNQVYSADDTPHKKVDPPIKQGQSESKAVVVECTDRQVQLEKLQSMRQRMQKSATFSSFSPNFLPNSKKQSIIDPRKIVTMSERKYQKFRNATRGTAKDRRKIFGNRQRSLPISLETLHEEDESRPAFLQQKSNSLDFLDDARCSDNASSDITSRTSPVCDPGDTVKDGAAGLGKSMEIVQKIGPKIITSVPSTSSVERADSCLSEAGEIMNDKPGRLQGKAYDKQHLLVIKKIIESKDSGFGNDASNGGSPINSPVQQETPAIGRSSDQTPVEHLPTLPKPYERIKSGGELREDGASKLRDEKVKRDLCVQVDFSDYLSDDSCSDTEYSSTGVQTSPWLQSGEVSPLYCGPTARGLLPAENDVVIDSASKSDVDVRKLSDEDFMKYCDDILEKHGKENNKQNGQRLEYPDGFIPEKRRLSKIDETTESSQSHQSEEELVKINRDIQPDGSQAVSSSSSRTASSVVISETRKSGEDPPHSGTKSLINPSSSRKASSPMISEGRTSVDQSHLDTKQPRTGPKRLKKKTFQEMLSRNTEVDLDAEKTFLQLRASQQAGRRSAQMTVDETLTKAAKKLELYITNKVVDSNEPKMSFRRGSLHSIEEEHFTSSGFSLPEQIVTKPLSHHPRAVEISPSDNSFSRRSQLFFAGNSFLSFTDSVSHLDRSDVSADSDSDVASFFSLPVFEEMEEDCLNFSLTGSDINFNSWAFDRLEDERPFFYHNPNVADGNNDIVIHREEDFDLSGADSMKMFTQHLEIHVPGLNQTVFSHKFATLQQRLTANCNDQGKRAIALSPMKKYSSKYYFSVEDYSRNPRSCDMTEEDRVSLNERRKSLLEAHLSAKEHTYDETIESVEPVTEQLPLFRVSLDNDNLMDSLNQIDSTDGFKMASGGSEVKHAKFMIGGFKRKPSPRSVVEVGQYLECQDLCREESQSLTSSRVDSFVDNMLDEVLEQVKSNEIEPSGVETNHGKASKDEPLPLTEEEKMGKKIEKEKKNQSPPYSSLFCGSTPTSDEYPESKLGQASSPKCKPQECHVANNNNQTFSPSRSNGHSDYANKQFSNHVDHDTHLLIGAECSGDVSSDKEMPREETGFKEVRSINDLCSINFGLPAYVDFDYAVKNRNVVDNFSGSNANHLSDCNSKSGDFSLNEPKQKTGNTFLRCSEQIDCQNEIPNTVNLNKSSKTFLNNNLGDCQSLNDSKCNRDVNSGELPLFALDSPHVKTGEGYGVIMSYEKLHERAERLLSNMNALIAQKQ